MTSPKIRTFYGAGSRWYVHPGDPEDKVPGVTSILNMLPKGYLKAWAAKLVAEEAVAKIAYVAPMIAEDPDGAVDYLKRAPERFTRAAADVGTAAHGVFETLSLGIPLGPITEDLIPFARGAEALLNTVEPEILRTEETVWNRTHSYAGSFDGYANVSGYRTIFDWKTTRSGVHAEVALQLAAYAHAEAVLNPEDGSEGPMFPVERGLVFHVRPDGWGVYEVPVGDDVFEYFLALRKVFAWDTKASRGIPGRPAVKGVTQVAGS